MEQQQEQQSSQRLAPPPKKIGILVVGLGGNNGVTMVAGLLANSRAAAGNDMSWETSSTAGRVSAPNWNGCITQLKPKGKFGGVGFHDPTKFPLADATHCAIGGWDIRSTPLGDALYESRVLDYDLVRQVREEMNGLPIWRGIYNASFVGESQHATATHTVSHETASTVWAQVEHVRKDIRNFIKQQQVDGHTTVIWSASVEQLSQAQFKSADDLIQAILDTENDGSHNNNNENNNPHDISPSMIYAVAAALEGCSFVNGGSQNTLSDAMCELYESSYRSKLCGGGGADDDNNIVTTKSVLDLLEQQRHKISTQSAYILGTDFKAGQTKFKTAAVEYIRALGLTPRVIASSNHLGNNDMLNLTSKKTVEAKMRVKSNIFGPWEEDQLDHQVRVMYTPFMLDEKRDIVEYTSLGFLHCPHTMLTYTRCMDSVLCVPLMIDAAVWCDLFARYQAPSSRVARATAYLFKVPEGGAIGLDPGFQRQMQHLEKALEETVRSKPATPTTSTTRVGDEIGATSSSKDASFADLLSKAVAAGIISPDQAAKMAALP